MKFTTSGYFLFFCFYIFINFSKSFPSYTIIPLSRHNPEQVAMLQNFLDQNIICVMPTLKNTVRSWTTKSGYRWLSAFDADQNLVGVAMYGLFDDYCWLYIIAALPSENLANFVHLFIPEIQKLNEGLPIHGYAQGTEIYAALSEYGFIAEQEFFIMKKTTLQSVPMTEVSSGCCIHELDTNDHDMMQAYAALFNEKECGASWDETSLQKYIQKHPAYHFLALHNEHNQLCAGLIYFLTDDGACKIELLSVHPDHRHQGYGTLFLSYLQNWAIQQGVDTLTLSVLTTNNPARACYEKFGFCYNDMMYFVVQQTKT